MKNIWVTVIVGFIAGLIISGILFDVIVYIGKSFDRIYVAWNASKAEKALSEERFSDAVLLYKKIYPKISADNKMLLAKTKNNFALSIARDYEKNKKDVNSLNLAVQLLQEAQTTYLDIGEEKLARQTNQNIQIIKNYQNKASENLTE